MSENWSWTNSLQVGTIGRSGPAVRIIKQEIMRKATNGKEVLGVGFGKTSGRMVKRLCEQDQRVDYTGNI